MGIISGIRTVNSLIGGSMSGAQLETYLATGANKASFIQALATPAQARALASSSTGMNALVLSNAGLAVLFNSVVARTAVYDNDVASVILFASATAKTHMNSIAKTVYTASALPVLVNKGKTFFLQHKDVEGASQAYAGVSGEFNTNSTTYVDRYVKLPVLYHYTTGSVTSYVTYIDMD